MKVHLVTFSDESMSRSAQLCIESASHVGSVDDSLRWYYDDFIQTDFYKQNIDILSQPRGLGYWAWKPWIIDKAMHGIITSRQFEENSFYPPKDGDILIYSDAGIEFINPVSHIIDRMDQDIFLFGNNWEHAHWCKRDVIDAVWPWWNRGRPSLYQGDEVGDRVVNVFVGSEPRARDITIRELAWERFRKQVQASVIFFRVSDHTRAFVAEWLKWCLFEGGRLIDDSPSRLPNHPQFQEHRHDQAILTTMAYRDGVKLHYWPAMYNDGAFSYEKLPEYAADDYPILFHHHRKRNHEWNAAA